MCASRTRRRSALSVLPRRGQRLDARSQPCAFADAFALARGSNCTRGGDDGRGMQGRAAHDHERSSEDEDDRVADFVDEGQGAGAEADRRWRSGRSRSACDRVRRSTTTDADAICIAFAERDGSSCEARVWRSAEAHEVTAHFSLSRVRPSPSPTTEYTHRPTWPHLCSRQWSSSRTTVSS